LFGEAVSALGGDYQVLSIEKAATKSELKSLESKLCVKLPSSLKDVLLGFSRKVEFRWFFPIDFQLEGDLSEIFSGDRHWSLDWLVQFDEAKNKWRDEVFPNRNDPYDVIWHDKLAFHEVGNGDYLAIDLSRSGYQPVVYLSHGDGVGHGLELAKNFQEFVFCTSRLGCVGGEDWQLLPFLNVSGEYVDPEIENANIFRNALGVKI